MASSRSVLIALLAAPAAHALVPRVSCTPAGASVRPPMLLPRRHAATVLQAEPPSAAEDDLGPTPTAYALGGRGAMLAWSACALVSLATYKPHRLLHNSIGVAQALTALPLLQSSTTCLAEAARGGWSQLARPEHRTLNLGLAAAALWSAVTVAAAPLFTSARVRTIDPVVYPLPLRLAAVAAHLFVAALSLRSWAITNPPAAATTQASEWAADTSRLRLSSSVVVDDPLAAEAAATSVTTVSEPSAERRSQPQPQYTALALAFGLFSALSLLAPFPLATVPSLMGKRLARASGAWTLLAATQLAVLGGGCGGASLRRELRSGLLTMAVAHLAVAAARPLLESPALYPAAMACLPAVGASLVVHVLVVLAVWREK